jgi:diacylglycerol kinase family enzyme
MYYYIYDQFLGDKKYDTLLAKIENRLTDLEIKGKIGRLSLLNNPQELISDEIKKGATTIVAVGDDITVNKVVNVLAFHPEICLGIIPIGQNLKIAQTLGLNDSLESCNSLASRIIKQIDMGKIKNNFFLSQVEIQNGNLLLNCDDKYTVTVNKKHTVNIFNFNYWSDQHLANPTDGFLETVIISNEHGFLKKMVSKNKPRPSLLLNKKIIIQHLDAPLTIKIDGQQTLKTPLLVEVANKKLKVIVGKSRIFI